MAVRKLIPGDYSARPERDRLFEAARQSKASDADLQERELDPTQSMLLVLALFAKIL